MTAETNVVLPYLKTAWNELKAAGWDRRTWLSRAGIIAVLAAALAVSGPLAVMGGGAAVVSGVSIWIVLGPSGGTFLETLRDELG